MPPDMHWASAGKWTAASGLYAAPIRFAMRPRGEAGIVGGGEAGLLGGLFVIIVVDLIDYRCVLLVQFLDHLLEVSLDARSQVLLV